MNEKDIENVTTDTDMDDSGSSGSNLMDLSDEDFLKAEPSFANLDTREDTAEKTEDPPSDDAKNFDDSDLDTSGSDNSDDTDGSLSDNSSSLEEEGEEDNSSSGSEDKNQEDAQKDEPENKDNGSEIDYKAEYEKVMAPFQANGMEMKPKNVDDIVRLMQMGANYHKKMLGLKPSMKILKLLENNDLLDMDKLNYLIDLNSKDPAAITKLLKESGMDPLDIDTKSDTNYTPTSRKVSDTEIDLDSVLESIKDTPTYNKTLTIVTKEWDTNSRTAVANAPHTLATLNQHVADGTYEKVMGAVQYERSLGKLQGISDLDAYKSMGDQLWNQGTIGPNANQTGTTPQAKPTPVKPKTSTVTNAQRKAQKKAASPTGNRGKSVAAPNFNPLTMSDEEIEKFDENQLKTFA